MLDTSVVNLEFGKKNQTDVPAAVTDIGCEREINEDRYAVADSSSGRAWIVCDGMGGEVGGELAAQLAIDAIKRALESGDFGDTSTAISSAIQEANRIIVLRRQNPAFGSMGTTVVAALSQDDEISIAHAGDSRAYVVRADSIQQLTVDHTYVQELVDKGDITAEAALTHPQAHVLTRCLGSEAVLKVDLKKFWVWPAKSGMAKDKLVLCSDGLYSLVSDEEISAITNQFSPQEACVKMVELARERGGYDNITLAILPLDGKLSEEPSKERLASKRKVKSGVPTVTKAPLQFKKRLLVMLILMVLGSISSLVVVLLKLLGVV